MKPAAATITVLAGLLLGGLARSAEEPAPEHGVWKSNANVLTNKFGKHG